MNLDIFCVLLNDQLEITMRDTIGQIIRGLHKVLSVDDIVVINLSQLKAIEVLLTTFFGRPQSNRLCPIPTQSSETRRHGGKNGDTQKEQIQVKSFLCGFKALKFCPIFLISATIKHIMSSLSFCERKVRAIRERLVQMHLPETQQLRNWKL